MDPHPGCRGLETWGSRAIPPHLSLGWNMSPDLVELKLQFTSLS